MTAYYPDSIPSYPTLANGVDYVLAEHQNTKRDEIVAIATELGTNPKTITDATTPTATPDDVAQYLDMVATQLKAILGESNWYSTPRANLFNLANTRIHGARLIWNSVNSLSVDIGSCYAENGDFINITGTLTASSLSLSNSTWYHIYVYLNSGVPAMEVVTTAPVAWKGSAYSKKDDTSRRYVGSVKTNSSGEVINFLMSGNQISYRANSIVSPLRVLNGGSATSETTIDASGIVPVTARIAILRIFNGATSAGFFITGTSDDGITISSTVGVTITGLGSTTVCPHPLDASRALTYLYSTTPSGGAAVAYVDVYGYILER